MHKNHTICLHWDENCVSSNLLQKSSELKLVAPQHCLTSPLLGMEELGTMISICLKCALFGGQNSWGTRLEALVDYQNNLPFQPRIHKKKGKGNASGRGAFQEMCNLRRHKGLSQESHGSDSQTVVRWSSQARPRRLSTRDRNDAPKRHAKGLQRWKEFRKWIAYIRQNLTVRRVAQQPGEVLSSVRWR